MVLPVRRHTIRRESERRERHRGERRFRPIWWWWLLLLLGFVVVVCRLLLSPAAPLTEPGGSWPATASWTGRIEGQEGTSPFASPSLKGESLVKKVRRLLQQKHDESNLENNEHADACMQPHYSPSGGGTVDQGLCIGNGLARQPVVDSFADATIHGWAAAGD